jgi:signal transduction histidine kinase
MIRAESPSSSRLAHTREAVELHREEFALVHAVSEAANESTSLSAVLSEVVQMVCESFGWPIGHALSVTADNPPTARSLDVWYLADPQVYGRFRTATDAMPDCGALARLFGALEPFTLAEIAERPEFRRRATARELGLSDYYAIPILSGTELVAALEFVGTGATTHPPEQLRSLLTNIGTALGRVAERELRERQRLRLIRAELAREEALQKAAELQRLAAELRRRNRELDQFAYVVSHDLRAPLRGIANLASWLAEDLEPDLSEDARRYLGLLEGRVARMDALITGLLEYFRAGRRAAPEEPIEVHTLVHELIDLLDPGRPVEWQVASLPSVRGPRVLLQQVFHNLLSNAIEHSRDAELRVEVAAEPVEPDGCWRFFVRDNGPGIAQSNHERIWEIFQTLQAHDSGGGNVESTGIGLALVRKIVEQRGGEVGIESTPGVGACFSFTWPRPDGS